jgi:hypothetical protein
MDDYTFQSRVLNLSLIWKSMRVSDNLLANIRNMDAVKLVTPHVVRRRTCVSGDHNFGF